jgi:hypothetical protein
LGSAIKVRILAANLMERRKHFVAKVSDYNRALAKWEDSEKVSHLHLTGLTSAIEKKGN